MEFDGIDNLNEEEILEMYYDVIETSVEKNEFLAETCFQIYGSSSYAGSACK